MSIIKENLTSQILDCKTPWSISELNLSDRECNETEYDMVFEIYFATFKESFFNNIPNCPRSCEDVIYNSRVQFFKKLNGMVHYLRKEDMQGRQIISLYFAKSEATLEEFIPTLTTWGLISACGGSLGLFPGFSCFGLVSNALDLIKQH